MGIASRFVWWLDLFLMDPKNCSGFPCGFPFTPPLRKSRYSQQKTDPNAHEESGPLYGSSFDSCLTLVGYVCHSVVVLGGRGWLFLRCCWLKRPPERRSTPTARRAVLGGSRSQGSQRNQQEMLDIYESSQFSPIPFHLGDVPSICLALSPSHPTIGLANAKRDVEQCLDWSAKYPLKAVPVKPLTPDETKLLCVFSGGAFFVGLSLPV